MRYITDLKRNLFSIEQLYKEGYSTTFTYHSWKITKEAIVLTHGKNVCTLYMTSNSVRTIAIVDAYEKSNKWHQMLDHISEKVIMVFVSKGKFLDVK